MRRPLKKPRSASLREVVGGDRRVEHRQRDLDRALRGVDVDARRHGRRAERRVLRQVEARRRPAARARRSDAASSVRSIVLALSRTAQSRSASASVRSVFAASALSATSASRMATRASMSTSAFDGLPRRRQDRGGVGRLGLAEDLGRGRPDDHVLAGEAGAQQALHRRRGLGGLGGAERLHRRRPGAAVGVVEIRLPRGFGHGVAERAERGHDGARTVQSGIGVDPRQHLQELRPLDRSERGARPPPASSAIGSPSQSSRRSIGRRRLEGAEGDDDLDLQRRHRAVGASRSAISGATARSSPSRPRPRTACSRTAGRCVGDASTSSSGGTAIGRLLRQAEPLGGECGAVEAVALEQELERRQRPRIVGAAQREGDRPPARCAACRRPRGSPAAARRAPSAGPARRSPRRQASTSGASGQPISSAGTVASAPPAMRPVTKAPIGAAAEASPIRPSASAARPRTSGEASPFERASSAGTDALSPSRPSPNAAAWRTSISASPSSASSAGRPADVADAADRERGAPPQAGVGARGDGRRGHAASRARRAAPAGPRAG